MGVAQMDDWNGSIWLIILKCPWIMNSGSFGVPIMRSQGTAFMNFMYKTNQNNNNTIINYITLSFAFWETASLHLFIHVPIFMFDCMVLIVGALLPTDLVLSKEYEYGPFKSFLRDVYVSLCLHGFAHMFYFNADANW